MCVMFHQCCQCIAGDFDVQDPRWQLSLVAAQVAELEVQLALVTARLHALEAAAGQDGPPTALLARDGGAAEAACAPAGLQRPRALSLGQGTGEQAPLCSPLASSRSVSSKLMQLCVRRLASWLRLDSG